MSTRYLATAAVLLGSVCGAHADVMSSSPSAPASTYLTSWTSNGTDIASSGVFGSGASLVGGSTYGSGNLTQSLMQQASANAGTSTKLSYEKGVNGTYVVATSNFTTAAMLGEGVSLVAGNNGKFTLVTSPSASASTPINTASGSGSDSVGIPAAGTPSSGTPSSGTPTAGTPTTVKTPTGGTGTGTDVSVSLPSDVSGGSGIGGNADVALPLLPAPALVAVPEPSSIALLFAGMLGALALNRRRKR